jgi:hypothetical protein
MITSMLVAALSASTVHALYGEAEIKAEISEVAEILTRFEEQSQPLNDKSLTQLIIISTAG